MRPTSDRSSKVIMKPQLPAEGSGGGLPCQEISVFRDSSAIQLFSIPALAKGSPHGRQIALQRLSSLTESGRRELENVVRNLEVMLELSMFESAYEAVDRTLKQLES